MEDAESINGQFKGAMTEIPDGHASVPEQEGYVSTSGRPIYRHPPPDISREELIAAHRAARYAEEEAQQLTRSVFTYADRGSHGVWGPDLCLLVARLSPEHEGRMRAYLLAHWGWSSEQFDAQLRQLNDAVASDPDE